MNSFFRREWLQVLILILPYIILPLAWPLFPERIPTHWDLNGNLDGWMMKGIGYFFTMLILPTINLGMALLLGSLAKIDPKFATINVSSTSLRPIRYIVTTFLLVLFILIVCTSAELKIDMSVVPEILILSLFLALGIYLPYVKPNYFVGIRDPWTLEDPEIWEKTHRLAGKVWPIGAAMGIVFELLMPSLALLFIVVGALVLIPLVYSFMLFRQKKKSGSLA